MKLIETIPGALLVKVYWNRTWGEYQVKAYEVVPLGRPVLRGEYHTSDKADAQATARIMAQGARE